MRMCLRDGNNRVVTLFLKEVVTVTETKFLMSTETYSKIPEIAEQFKDSIKRALMQLDEWNEDMYEERSTAGTQDGEHRKWSRGTRNRGISRS